MLRVFKNRGMGQQTAFRIGLWGDELQRDKTVLDRGVMVSATQNPIGSLVRFWARSSRKGCQGCPALGGDPAVTEGDRLPAPIPPCTVLVPPTTLRTAPPKQAMGLPF